MKIKKNDIVKLSNNEKILVLDSLNYMNHDFIFVNSILPDESDITNNYKIMLVNNNSLLKVTNVEVLSMILPQFVANLSNNSN